jgi:hypothetical protein
MKLGKQHLFDTHTLNFTDNLAPKQMLYGLTQIAESSVKEIDSSA